jgi:hypothetical protein
MDHDTKIMWVFVYMCASSFIYVWFYTLKFLEICISGGVIFPEYILTYVHVRTVMPNLDPCQAKVYQIAV